jgi:hypothetical protein
VSFGFLPNLAVADNLARQIARREERRRDSWLVKMPIPDQWGDIGYRPLALCKIGSRRLQIDAPVIVIRSGEAYLEFEGGLVDTATIEIIDITAGFAIEVGVSVGAVTSLDLEAAVICEAMITVGTPGGGGGGNAE